LKISATLKTILLLFFLILSACGGSSSDSSTETQSDCVLGTSKIGGCQI